MNNDFVLHSSVVVDLFIDEGVEEVVLDVVCDFLFLDALCFIPGMNNESPSCSRPFLAMILHDCFPSTTIVDQFRSNLESSFPSSMGLLELDLDNNVDIDLSITLVPAIIIRWKDAATLKLSLFI